MLPPTSQLKAASRVTTTPVPSHLLPVVPTKQQSFTTPDGCTTEIFTQAFHDRILVLITQVGKVGCLIQSQTSTSLFRPSSHPDRVASSLSLDDTFDETTSSPSTLPAPSSCTILSHLFGTPPYGYATLYDLYVSQVAAIIAHDLAKTYQDSATQRPVVVGLGLKILKKAEEEDQQEDEDDEMAPMASERERERFLAIMQKVGGCRVW